VKLDASTVLAREKRERLPTGRRSSPQFDQDVPGGRHGHADVDRLDVGALPFDSADLGEAALIEPGSDLVRGALVLAHFFAQS
jgi:hypothetical protein